MISALKFLGWINDANDVQAIFTRFVDEEKERAKIMRELVAKLYPDAAKLAPVHATAAQYAETFAPYTGETLRKAMTFYLHAAKFGGHPISKNFKVQRATRAAKKPRNSGASESASATPSAPTPPGANGGTLDAARARYLEMLMEKAKGADATDTTLLDRIEKLLGYDNKETTNA
jgi:hypothetical protein